MFSDLIMNFVKEHALEQISRKIGIDPSLLKGEGTQDAIWSLVTWLFRNTQEEEWLESLDKALEKDHDWSVFDDVASLLTKWEEWSKIVDHILWNKQWVIVKLLAQKLGITTDQAQWLLTFVAPLVMGALGKTKQETGVTSSWLKEVIKQEEEQLAEKSDTPHIITTLLDKDGDGDVDLADFLSY